MANAAPSRVVLPNARSGRATTATRFVMNNPGATLRFVETASRQADIGFCRDFEPAADPHHHSVPRVITRHYP